MSFSIPICFAVVFPFLQKIITLTQCVLDIKLNIDTMCTWYKAKLWHNVCTWYKAKWETFYETADRLFMCLLLLF